MNKILSFGLLCLMFLSCSNSNKIEPSEIIIKGIVLSSEIKEVKFILSKQIALKNDIKLFAKVREDSTFSITIPTKYSLSGRISFNNSSHPVYFTSSDNLKLLIENDSIIYRGKGSERNNFLEGIKEIFGIAGYGKILEHNNNKAYGLLAKKHINSLQIALKDFEKEYPGEKEFSQYYTMQNKLEYEHFLIVNLGTVLEGKEYGWNLDSLQLPKEYLVKDFFDDSKLSSRKYCDVMKYFIYNKVSELSKGDNSGIRDSLTEIVLFDSLTGKSKDYAIANWLTSEFNYFKYDSVIYKRFRNEITDTLVQNYVKKVYEKYLLKQKLIDKTLNEEFNQTLLEDDKGNKLSFGEMIGKYKDKIIYIDIWATWCGPCKGNMPKSKKLKNKFANQPIEFVYLLREDKRENLWDDVYKTSMTKENHYRFINGSEARFLKYSGITWVPNYLLIDKDGKLLSLGAIQPNDPKCEEELKKYLN